MATMPLAEDTVLEVSGGKDLTALALSQDEGFLVSRIMGRRQSVGELLQVSGMPADQARATLARLVIKGALEIVNLGSMEGGPVLDDAPKRESDPYEGFVFTPSLLAEAADLTVDQKKRILFVEAKLEEWSHYALLDLKRTATSSDIKRGYFKASKEFHPDAFFRKEIGSFKARVDRIFRRMKAAYDTLNDAKRREEYDLTLPPEFTPAEEDELRRLAEVHLAKQKEKAREQRLQERMKAKRLQRNPMTDRILKARELLKMAEDARLKNKVTEAARHAKMAMEYAPQDQQIAMRARVLVEEANVERAKALAKRVPSLIEGGDKDEMCNAAEELAELAPRDAKLLAKAAELLLAGGRPQRGMKLAQQACGVDGDCKPALEALFRLAEKTSSWNAAFRAAESLVRLDPKNGQYKEWLKLAKRMK